MNEALDQALAIGGAEPKLHYPTPLDRLIMLRTLPNLSVVAGRGLTFIAARASENHYDTGELLFRPDEPVTSVHFIAEGKVRVEQEGLHLVDVEAPFGVGFLPILSSSDVGQTTSALEPTVTLAITREDLFEIIEDDPTFMENGIRQLAKQFSELQTELEIAGHVTRSEPEETPYPINELDLVERLDLMLGGPFANVNLEPMVQLARGAEEVRVEAGEVLWEEGDESTCGLHIVHGVVACESATRKFRMGPRSVLGISESHGRIPRSYRAVAETRVVALRSRTEGFFDVLEDNFALASEYLNFMSTITMDLTLKRARLRAEAARS